MEETEVPREIHRPTAISWQTLPYNVLSSGPSPWSWFELTIFKWLITKEVTRIRNSKKDMQYIGNTKQDKRQTAIYKSLPLSLKTEQHEPLILRWLNRVLWSGKQILTH